MSLHNIAWRIFAVITAMVTGPAAFGQVFHPFGDPLDVDPDWQFFAPVDVEELTEMSPRKRSNTGWFGAYDRTYLWVSRPSVEESAARGDFGWGNRYEIGFMNEEDRGWVATFRNIGGPNVYDRTTVERIDRVNANDTGDPVNNPILPPWDANDPQLGFRAYVLGDSLNVVGLTSFELNRTWRRSPYRYGGMLEAMLGIRYDTLKNHALNQTYVQDAVNFTEELTSYQTDTLNQMYGGQIGARYFNHSGRWTVSAEFRAMLMGNSQSRNFRQTAITTTYTGLGGTVVSEDRFSNAALPAVVETNNTLVYGFNARAEAAYHVTKSFQIRGGLDVLNLATGIWRAGNPGFGGSDVYDDDVQMAGFTFGLTINR